MLDPRDRQFVATLGFAAMVAVLVAALAQEHAGVDRWALGAVGVWIALVPVAWKLTYGGFERYDVAPMDLSDLGNAVLFGAVGAAGLYAASRLVPDAVPGWLRFVVLVVVVAPLSTRAFAWVAERLPGGDPEYAD
ncbi:hypothetical protein [Natronoarchaeum rubrum]|uniref:hypothetical protein n=1 Tax=Natronoarchaeum rubrum TaxID=755311 RepID=UPI002113540E|nr:hypothetical protein [Natronoarchaeum rubrum]